MNGTRVALIAFVAACALAAWPRHETIVGNHGPTRQFVIQSTLGRFDDAIVVLGDSIVESSTLPRSMCGHTIVNAGIGGASTASDLGSMLSASLAGKRAALVVVSLGSNDAVAPLSVESFRSSYRALLDELAGLTSRRAVAAIPPPEIGLDQSNKISVATINSYNAILPELAREAGAAFVSLPAMPSQHTIDGIHLNKAGYQVWENAIVTGIESAVCKT